MPPKKKAEPTAYEMYAATLRAVDALTKEREQAEAELSEINVALGKAHDELTVAEAALKAEALKG